MQIPQYWAEARVVDRVQGRQRVVRRFGWSDESLEHAERQAHERARAAMAELQAGHQVAPREPKLPYGGFGLPIREQVLAHRGDVVITRNSYGAHCLNEPDVLFADVDVTPRLADPLERGLTHLIGLLFVTGCLFALWLLLSRGAGACGLVLVATLAVPLAIASLRGRLRSRPSTRAASRARTEHAVRELLAHRSGGRFALYETPAGFRVLALHGTFDPRGEAAQQLLHELHSDPAYVQMCQLQACFRARVSGKPWRMDVRQIVPRPGVWPVQPARMADRSAWIVEYEAVAKDFAACRFLAEVGNGPVHPRCAEVQRIHDELSRARSNLPLA